MRIMQGGHDSIGPAAANYKECSFLYAGFAHVIFYHSARESNRVAHTLARKTEGAQPTTWLEDPPVFITELLIHNTSLFAN